MMASVGVKAQVTIGSLSEPDGSALLDLNTGGSHDKGLLLPIVQLEGEKDVETVENPATGLLVYSNGLGGLQPAGVYVWNGAMWVTTGAESNSDYALALSPRTLTFAPTTYGATPPAAQTVMAYNFSDLPTGDLSFGGAIALSYTMSPNPVPSIASDGNTVFSIQPRSNLYAGSYSGTITVTNANVPEQDINVTYTVNQITPVITFNAFAANTNATDVNPGATVNPSTLQSSLTYSIIGTNSIGVTTNGSTVSAGATAGTVTIRATVTGNDNYTGETKDAVFTVYDCDGAVQTSSNLCWYKEDQPQRMRWAVTYYYCASGFRVPSMYEMRTLYNTLTDHVTFNGAIGYVGTATAMHADSYWASETDSTGEWGMYYDFSRDSMSAANKSTTMWVRCVKNVY
jgi:hypothetical protein